MLQLEHVLLPTHGSKFAVCWRKESEGEEEEGEGEGGKKTEKSK